MNMSSHTHKHEDLVSQVYQRLKSTSGSVLLSQLVAIPEQVAPGHWRNPAAAIRRLLHAELGAIRVGRGEWILLENALAGYQVRLQPRPVEVETGLLFLQSRLTPFFSIYPPGLRPLSLETETGQVVLETEIDPLEPAPLSLSTLYQATGFQIGDSWIATALDLWQGRFSIRREPAADRREAWIDRYNRLIGDAAAIHLFLAKSEQLDLNTLLPSVLVKLPQLKEYPAGDFRQLFAFDGRFRLLEGGILTNSSFRRPADYLFAFPRWGVDAAEALNPGFFVPQEIGEAESAFSTTLWIQLRHVKVDSISLQERWVRLRLQMNSSSGDYASEIEVPLQSPTITTRAIMNLASQRYAALLSAQLPRSRRVTPERQIRIEAEPQARTRLALFLKPLIAAAKRHAQQPLSDSEILHLKAAESNLS